MRVILVHWKPEESQPVLDELRAAGFEVDGDWKNRAAAAIVIDLSRVPSHGRGVAEAWRGSKASRHVPIVFAGGSPDKVEATRARFPDAVYASYGALAEAVKAAIRNAPDEPVVYRSMLGYSGTPLAKKLGLKSTLVLIGAPQGWERHVPEQVRFVKSGAHRVILFAASHAELRKRFARAAASVEEGGGLWIAYPKKASGVASDLTQAAVREFGMASGWVDYKVCAIDETWTGLLFAKRAAIPSKYPS